MENKMVVSDVWGAIKLIGTILLVIAGLSFVPFFLVGQIDILSNYTWQYAIYVFFGILFVFFIPIKKVWNAYYAGYEVDLEDDTFSFPASDVENSVMDIVTLKRLRNLLHRETINLDELEALNNETKRWTTKSKDSNGRVVTHKHVKYLLNISGDFGSRQFNFDNKQKRDECRAMLNRAVKQQGLRLNSSDMNLDFQ